MDQQFNLYDIVKIKDNVKNLPDFKYCGTIVDEIFEIICIENSHDDDIIVELVCVSNNHAYSKYTLNTITEYIEHVNPLLISLI